MEKKYLDLTGLQDVASHVNTRLKTVTTIPVSADDGAVRLYVGETNVNYTKGHIYQYDLANTQWNDITGSSGGGAVDSVNGKTGNVVLNAKDIGLQYDTMPTASVAYENHIVQYTGTTNASYTNGYFYKCVEDGGVYSWILVADFALASDVYTKTQVGALTDLPDTSKNIVQNIDAINTAVGDKTDKVSSATNGDLAGLDASGNLTDSGILATNVIVKSNTAGLVKNDGTIDESTYLTSADIADKADVVSGATNGDLAGLNVSGNLTDSGILATDVVQKSSTSGLLKNDGTVDTNTYLTATDISDKANMVSSATNGDLAGLDSNGDLTDSGIAATNVIVKSNTTGLVKNDGTIDTNTYLTSADIADKADVVDGATVDDFATLDASGNLTDSGINKNIVPSNASSSNKLATANDIPDEISDLDDVEVTNPVNAQILAYNSTSGKWENQTGQAAIGGAVFKGSINFANLPTTGMINGDWYDIKDAFTTDNRFEEGSGIACAAGTDVIWVDTDSKWNILTPSGVYSFNGRVGAVIPASSDYDASDIDYDNTTSGLTATDVQDAIDEINTNVSGKADKVTNATNGHLANLNSSGNLTDSGVASDDVIVKSSTAGLVKNDGTIDTTTYANDFDVVVNRDTLGTQRYNLYYQDFPAGEKDGVTLSKGSTGYYSFRGTPTSEYASFKASPIELEEGSYKITGCPSGGGSSTYQLLAFSTNVYPPSLVATDNGEGADIEIGWNSGIYLELRVYGEVTSYTPFNPMIAHSDYSGNYQVAIKPLQKQITIIDNKKPDYETIANLFDSSTSYAVGDYCVTNQVLYRCTTAHTGGWNPAHFTAVNVCDELELKASQSDVSSKADLTDIAPAFSTNISYSKGDYVTYNGDVYIFDSAHSGAWNIMDAHTIKITEEIKKRQIKTSFDTDDFNVVIELVDLEGHPTNYNVSLIRAQNVDMVDDGVTSGSQVYNAIQSATGNLQDNIKANTQLISESIWGKSGKNLIKNTLITSTTNGITISVDLNGVITANGTATANTAFEINYSLPAGSYILNGCNGGASGTYFIDTYENRWTNRSICYDGDVSFTFTTDSGHVLRCYFANGTTVSNVVLKPMIRKADILDPTYEPFHDAIENNINANTALINESIWGESGKNIWSTKADSVVSVKSGTTYTFANNVYTVNCDTTDYAGIYWSTTNTRPLFTGYSGVKAILSFDVKADAETSGIVGFSTAVKIPTTYIHCECDIADLSQIDAITFYSRDTSNARTITVKNMMIRLADVLDSTYEPYHSSIKDTLREAEVIEGKNKLNVQKVVVNPAGITPTLNNGIITLTGTATTDAYVTMTESNIKNEYAGMILSDGGAIPTSLNNKVNVRIRIETDEGVFVRAEVVPTNGEITIPTLENGQRYRIDVLVKNEADMGSGVVIKPMIRLATETDSTYEPYYIPLKDSMFPREEQAVLGAKNLYKSRATTTTDTYGLTWTVDATDNNIVTVSGTPIGFTAFNTFMDTPLPSGDYVLSGAENLINATFNTIIFRKGTTIVDSHTFNATEYNKPWKFNIPSSLDYDNFMITFKRINNNVACSGTAKIMISLATDTNYDYVPYAMTNRELTKQTPFMATYNVTSYNEINSAYAMGRNIIVRRDVGGGVYFEYVLTSQLADGSFRFTTFGNAYSTQYYCSLSTASVWAAGSTAFANKVTNATNGNFAGLDASGNLTDSGKSSSSFLPNNYLEQTVTTTANTDTTVTFTNNTITSDKVIEVFAGRSGGDVSGSQNVFPYKDIYVDGTNHTCTITYPALDTAISMKVRIYIY